MDRAHHWLNAGMDMLSQTKSHDHVKIQGIKNISKYINTEQIYIIIYRCIINSARCVYTHLFFVKKVSLQRTHI